MRTSVILVALSLVACDDDGAATPGQMNDDAAAADGSTGGSDAGSQVDAAPEADAAAAVDAGVEPEGCAVPELEPQDGQVATDRGHVLGAREGEVWSWKGIPFAAPPLGALRFRPPELHACWDDPRSARAFGPKCPQLEVTGAGVQAVGDEDCLTLNVWSPVDRAEGDPRPVLFFIHGGGHIIGSAVEEIGGGNKLYDGRYLAARGDAVVVTIQYRLGPLGFFTLPELDAENESGASGNQAHLDQIAALEWVQRNIARFGGDPERVMVFGESAGAVSTCSMVTSPLTEGLLHRAVMQSAGCGGASKADGLDTSERAAALFDCEGDDRLECLRAVDALELARRASGTVGIGASPGATDLRWAPIVDGHVLPVSPAEAIAAREHARVPMVIGSNADEMASRTINRVQVDTAEAYEAAVRALFGVLGADALRRIFETYPVDDFESPDDAFVQVTTDAFFTRTTRSLARALVQGQEAPVYRYFFTRRFESRRGEGRARHGIELLYVFGTLGDIPGFRPVADDRALSEEMMDTWLRFAATGEPGGSGAPWPAYALGAETSRIFDAPSGLEDEVRAAKCDLWDALLAGF